MSLSLVLVTDNISVQAILDGSVSPVTVVREQFQTWYCSPVEKLLAENKNVNGNFGYSIVMLTLSQFEPLGRYLTGKQEKSRISGELFDKAFTEFMNYCKLNNKLDIDTLGAALGNKKGKYYKMYEMARCGLMHTSIINEGLLVDKYGLNTEMLQIRRLFGNSKFVVIDPSRFHSVYCGFFENYLNKIEILIENEKHGKLTSSEKNIVSNFRCGFEFIFNLKYWKNV